MKRIMFSFGLIAIVLVGSSASAAEAPSLATTDPGLSSGVRIAQPVAAFGVTAAADQARVRVRRQTVVGRRVTVVGTGLTPGFHTRLSLSPAKGGNCCGIRIGKTRVVPESGRLRFRFRWPRAYYVCAGAKSCSTRRRWRDRQRAIVSLGAREIDPRTHSNEYAGATVTVRTR